MDSHFKGKTFTITAAVDGPVTLLPIGHVPWLLDRSVFPLAKTLACMTGNPGVQGSKPAELPEHCNIVIMLRTRITAMLASSMLM